MRDLIAALALGVVVAAGFSISAWLSPDESAGIVLGATIMLWLVVCFVPVGYQLFKDARWVIRRVASLLRPARSGARTTPDRTGR